MPYDLTPTDVAEILQVSPRTVHRYADSGELRCIRLPGGHRRFRREDVDEFIARLEARQADRVAARVAARQGGDAP